MQFMKSTAFTLALCAGACAEPEIALTGRAIQRLEKIVSILDSKEVAEVGVGAWRIASSRGGEHTGMIRVSSSEWLSLASEETGDIYRFTIKGTTEDEAQRSASLTHRQAISVETAFQAYLPLAKELALPLSQTEYQCVLSDSAEYASKAESDEKDLFGCDWAFSLDFKYQGLPCRDTGRDRGFLATVSALSGRITGFIHKPVVVPKSMQGPLPATEAIDVVKKWVVEQPYFRRPRNTVARVVDTVEPRLVIACPNPFPNEGLSLEQQIAAQTSSYCWEVSFEYSEQDFWFPAVAWVDTNTGEVIGGEPNRNVSPRSVTDEK